MQALTHHRLSRLLLIVLAFTAAAVGGPVGSDEPTESDLAHRVVETLEKGHYAEARHHAEKAAKWHPNNGLLQRRLAQANLCVALDLDFRFRRVSEDLAYSKALRRGVQMMIEPELTHEPDPKNVELLRDGLLAASREILTPEVLDRIDRFHLNSRDQFLQSRTLITEHHDSLTAASRALARAKDLGDASAEAKLTGLWAQVAILVWLRQAESVRRAIDGQLPVAANQSKAKPGKSDPSDELRSRLKDLEETITGYASTTPDAVLKSALELGCAPEATPELSAGAADVISVVAAFRKRPDLLGQYIQTSLSQRYLPKPPSPDAAAIKQRYRSLYNGARTKTPDVLSAPTAAAIYLYERALSSDAETALRYLPLRVYLLRAPFEREEAESLLDGPEKDEPQNAAFPLERARAALLLDRRPTVALQLYRDALTKPRFSRSFLVAVPAALRGAFSVHPEIALTAKSVWPTYDGVLRSFEDFRQSAPHGAERAEIRRMKLDLAQHLCRGVDYWDRALGVDTRTSALQELLKLGDRLPDEQRPVLQVLQREHQDTFSRFPRNRSRMILSRDGISFVESPRNPVSPFNRSRREFSIGPNGSLSGWLRP